MTNTTMGSLRELQTLDRRVKEIREKITAFDPLLLEVEEPALRLEDEHSKAATRLEQMRTDTRRLERNAEDKRARAKRLDERLNQVSNLREQTAVKTELDLVQRAIEADEHEALQLMEQIRRNEIVVDELAESSSEARADVLPRQEALLSERAELKERLEELSARREELMSLLDDRELRVYESFHASGRSVVVAALTEDGVCGHCFGLIPLQQQNEIRRGEGLHRCEACGVILTNEPEPVEPDPPASEAEADSEAGADSESDDADDSGEESSSPEAS